MAYNPPSLSESIAQIEGDIASELGLESHLPLVCSERAIAFALGASKRDLHDHLSWLSKQIVPNSESDDETIVKKAAYEGVSRKLAQKAKGQVSLSVVGEAVLEPDTALTSKSGMRYFVTDSGTHENGTMIATLNAEKAGAAGNLKPNDTMTFVSPPPGFSSLATVVRMEGGVDIESISELLKRLYFRKQNPPMGGALHDYIAWATEVPGVTRAWSYDAWHGGSTVGLTFVCDNEKKIIPSDTKIAEVLAYIYKHKDPSSGEFVGRPAGIETILFKLRLKEVQFSISLTPDTEETRKAIFTQLKQIEQYTAPASSVLLSHVRTAIGITKGIRDYKCSLMSDIHCEQDELITFMEPEWSAL